MRTARLGAALAVVLLSAPALAAQQPGPPHRAGMMGTRDMRMMDSLNARLDSLVDRMNRATGNEKMTAMAGVITEMVGQRKAMQQHMRQMGESRRGMGDMMKRRAPAADSARTGDHPQE